ncbi:gamma-parvin [Pteropus medius]|uniref:gamma-parvin n=1 Tax=Pteropus vampyrus TaxID=132908 RepID=UPI00196B6BEF|nr:gamma-parvin [Pteropus giganteus]
MEPESLYNLLQLPKEASLPVLEELPQGEKKKYILPTSRKDPRFEELQKVLMEWINAKLHAEHIVVRSLEEDVFDGLILHHLFQKLAGIRLEVEDIALTAVSQRRKLEVVLEAANRSLPAEEPQVKWSVDAIFSKDLLATLHLLVALAERFQPDLALPSNVQVEVITMESTKNGLKSEKSMEQLTACSTDKDPPSSEYSWDCPGGVTQLPWVLALGTLQVQTLGEHDALILPIQRHQGRDQGAECQSRAGPHSATYGSSHGPSPPLQFADGVILLLLIGQLGGFFLHLKEFYLTPSSPAEMLHNVTLALGLLRDEGLLDHPVSPEGECSPVPGGQRVSA